MRGAHLSRRAFLAGCALSLSGSSAAQRSPQRGGHLQEDDRTIQGRLTRLGNRLRGRFRDPRRHFIFEYYPWYGATGHWDAAGRTPPAELAASDLPLLGGYDSRSPHVIEQHARWIVEAGVGAINLSWWGRGSYEDNSVHVVMDVMRAFEIKVMFHLEPYSPNRGIQFADDVMYLLREYGERRRWDTLLLLEDADGRVGPVFKSFVTLLSPTTTDCRGVTHPVDVYVPDDVWRQGLARVRSNFATDFDRITFVADSLEAERTLSVGFDAGAVGNPYIRPEDWSGFTEPFDRVGIPFSFAVNAGFDAVEPKTPPDDPCYRPAAFEPDVEVRWDVESSREHAHLSCAARIAASLERTLAHQIDPRSANWRRGFLLVPINSFNEWHEGTAFEPMKSYDDLTPAERRLYHNPVKGSYRLDTLKTLLQMVF
jgi:Glycosyl hydrolase family 99